MNITKDHFSPVPPDPQVTGEEYEAAMIGKLTEAEKMDCHSLFKTGLGYEDAAVKLRLPVALVRKVMFPKATPKSEP